MFSVLTGLTCPPYPAEYPPPVSVSRPITCYIRISVLVRIVRL